MEPDASGGVAVRRRLRPEVQALRALAVGLVAVLHLNPFFLPGGFGDSHAGQWMRALEPVVAERGWELLTLVHANCPSSTEQRVRDVEEGGWCAEANDATFERLDDGGVDLVVASAWRSSTYVDTRTGEEPGVLGFATQWRELLAAGIDVLVVEDTPEPAAGAAVLDCLVEHPVTRRRARPRVRRRSAPRTCSCAPSSWSQRCPSCACSTSSARRRPARRSSATSSSPRRQPHHPRTTRRRCRRSSRPSCRSGWADDASSRSHRGPSGS